MQIVHTGPDGSTLTMDIPEDLLVVFKETHTDRILKEMFEAIAGKFFTTVILALIRDSQTVAGEAIAGGATILDTQGGDVDLILHRLFHRIDDFAKAEIPGLGDTSKSH